VQASEQRVVWSWKACTLITDFTNLALARELWIMLHTVKSIHSRHALTFTACVDVTCAKLQADKFHTGFPSTILKTLEITA